MRGRHHWSVLLVSMYDDEPTIEKELFKTNKRIKADMFVESHEYMEVLDSDYCYITLRIRKDY